MKPIIAVIMGSDSDLKYMQPAIQVLKENKISHEVKIVSAHRSPSKMRTFALSAQKRGIKIIIAGAGGAAHLPGMVASFTRLPVIGVPIKTANLDGLDSLLSVAQMPSGVPVATMAINGSKNASLLALRILALQNKSIAEKVKRFQQSQKQIVIKANKTLSL